ncbi:phage antirepressor KilAC domain-containing protein [Zavarzinia aquatilis]|uniref:DNA-binding protein n=1 Tax=Zavarzinia aquatilis TaxID=2211142 RepID=A0A317EBX9_9PROT|nr:phage antirepressor KilAC domain-containing protein [Zavarzinia aquatilis]PWR24578.1 DNA-binding protein [Zavarzinia aquatilis]
MAEGKSITTVRHSGREFSEGSPADLTMSSREIADLVEKRHDNVKRTIQTLAERGLVRFTQFEETSHGGAGARPVEVYRVGQRDSYVIVAQLSPEFTARLVDRWRELEERVRRAPEPTVNMDHQLNDPSFLRSALLIYTEKVIALEAERAELLVENTELAMENTDLRPKARVAERIAVADGLHTITEAAKILQLRPKTLFQWMRDMRWIYKRGRDGYEISMQARIETGCLHQKTVLVGGDSGERTRSQVFITAKGISVLARMLSANEQDV